MNKILFVFFILFSFSTIPSITWALPECPSSSYFHNCFGTYIWDNGDKYVGEWKDDKRHGQGINTWGEGPNKGDKYVGEWKDEKQNGQGTYTWANGDKYVGEYKGGKRHGQGTYTFPDGEKYVGEYKGGKRHGHGTYTYASGNKYIGEWKEDLENGQGTYYYLADDKYKGDIFIGEYRDGKKHGQGTYTFPDGSKGEGEWKDGKPNGYFIEYNADGSIDREGIYKDGEFLYAETREKKEPSKLDKFKSTCEELGFTLGTEKFGDCVLKLMDKD